MTYGELKGRALRWATEFGFGLSPATMPASVVISPVKIDECFEDFQTTMTSKALDSRRVGSGFLVWNDQKSARSVRVVRERQISRTQPLFSATAETWRRYCSSGRAEE